MANFVDLSLLFNQLQSRYPGSSLISELVQIHGDRLIVRASVQIGSTLLATGMASATTVEQAEDQAKVRVLALLGITTASPTKPNVPLQPLPPLPPLTFEPPFEPTAIEPPFEPTAIADPAIPSSSPILPDLTSSTAMPIGPLEEITPAESITPNPRPTPIATRNGKSRKSSPSKEVVPTNDEIATSPNAADLSDLITHIGVEMARVGWDSERGREHILQTYGKRSRAELDETQLLEFLHFLKALPTHYE